MKILYVTNCCPWPPNTGLRLRNFHLIQQLRQRFDVRVVALDEPPARGELPANTEFLPIKQLMPPTDWSRSVWVRRAEILRRAASPLPALMEKHSQEGLTRLFRSIVRLANEADRVWISRSYFARLALEAGLRRPLIVDYDDIDTYAQLAFSLDMPQRFYRWLSYLDTAKLYLFEQAIARRAWRCVVCKPEDQRFFRHRRRNVFVVPNGTEIRDPLPPEAEIPDTLLFVGLLSFHPNSDAVTWFVRECYPELVRLRPAGAQPTLEIVGAQPGPTIQGFDNGNTIRVRGFVPDLVDVYRRAGVAIAPIRMGSGTKLKVLEALSYGKALVATHEAIRGLHLRPGVDVAVADTATEFAAACHRLLNDPIAREKLGRSGRERVNALFSWERIGRTLREVVT